MFKKTLILFLAMVLIFLCSGCETGKDIAETARPSGVSQDITSTESEVESQPESVDESSDESEPEKQIEIVYPLKMYYSSGAGAWATIITLYEDGTFEGEYDDTDAGDIGDDYPNGTVYTCEFSGKFSELRYVNYYTFSLTLESIAQKGEDGETYIEDGVRYVISRPHGFYNSDSSAPAKNFLFYTPETPINRLNQDFLVWWPYRFEDNNYQTLMVYGLRNAETNDGFFS